jgi:hypothetical protein
VSASMKTWPATVTVHVPMRFSIRGGRKTVISKLFAAPDEGVRAAHERANALREVVYAPSQPRSHRALIKALARAHRWRRLIENGEYDSITELAKTEKVNQSYACRVLRLTLLAPAIVDDILNGRHDSNLMLKQIIGSLPIRWDEQMSAFNNFRSGKLAAVGLLMEKRVLRTPSCQCPEACE